MVVTASPLGSPPLAKDNWGIKGGICRFPDKALDYLIPEYLRCAQESEISAWACLGEIELGLLPEADSAPCTLTQSPESWRISLSSENHCLKVGEKEGHKLSGS